MTKPRAIIIVKTLTMNTNHIFYLLLLVESGGACIVNNLTFDFNDRAGLDRLPTHKTGPYKHISRRTLIRGLWEHPVDGRIISESDVRRPAPAV